MRSFFNLFGHRTPVVRSIMEIDFAHTFRRPLTQEHLLARELVVRLKQWSENRGWNQSDIKSLARYGVETLWEGLATIAWVRTPLEKAMEKVRNDYLIHYMSEHNWPEATAKDLCEQVIAPFWKEKDGAFAQLDMPEQISPLTAIRGMKK